MKLSVKDLQRLRSVANYAAESTEPILPGVFSPKRVDTKTEKEMCREILVSAPFILSQLISLMEEKEALKGKIQAMHSITRDLESTHRNALIREILALLNSPKEE